MRRLRSFRDADPTAETRIEQLFYQLLDAGVLIHTNGLGCLSTPMTERELEEIAVALDRAAGAWRATPP